MSESEDPAVTLDAKLHRFVDALTPAEVQVFNDLLEAWSDAGGSAEVEGFTVADDQRAMQQLSQLFSMLGNIMQAQHDASASTIRNLRG